MTKKLPFNFGDVIRATKDIEVDFGSCGDRVTGGNLYLVVGTDPGDSHPVYVRPFDEDERDEWEDNWMSDDECKNFDLVQAAPRQPKAEVSVDSSDPKTINIKVTLA